MVRAALVSLLASAIGCTGGQATPREPPGEITDAASPIVAERVSVIPDSGVAVDAGEALDATADAAPESDRLRELVDDEGRVGIVAVPRNAREPRPIVIALHGGSERPEVACAAWTRVVERWAFVLCPRGFGGNERRLGWHDPTDTGHRIERAIAAVKKEHGAAIRETATLVLVGFSMGGTQVARVAYREPRRYRRILVGDSAYQPRPALTFAHAWATGGGERALFLCTTSGCEPSQRAAARKVASEHRPARLNIAATQVHGLSELAVESLRRDWAWLVEGAEGWEGFAGPAPAPATGRTESFGP